MQARAGNGSDTARIHGPLLSSVSMAIGIRLILSALLCTVLILNIFCLGFLDICPSNLRCLEKLSLPNLTNLLIYLQIRLSGKIPEETFIQRFEVSYLKFSFSSLFFQGFLVPNK